MEQWQMICGVCAVFVIWNAITFLMMWSDKCRAVRNRWRIRESTLLWCAFLFGGVGEFVGMFVLRHKTLTRKFLILVPVAMVLNAVLLELGITLIKIYG